MTLPLYAKWTTNTLENIAASPFDASACVDRPDAEDHEDAEKVCSMNQHLKSLNIAKIIFLCCSFIKSCLY